MRKKVFIVVISLLLSYTAFAQRGERILEAFQRNFVNASLNVKVKILQDAAKMEGVDMGPLYHQAVKFTLNNSDFLRTESAARELSIYAMQLISKTNYVDAADDIWRVFEVDVEVFVRIAAMDALGFVAKDNKDLITKMNNWLEDHNTIYVTGQKVDLRIIRSCILALGRIGDVSSFQVLFSAMYLDYSDNVTLAAKQALDMVEGDYPELLMSVVEKNSIAEKKQALDIGLESERLTEKDKGSLAETALRTGITTYALDDDENKLLRQIRYTSTLTLTELKWSSATDAVIEHFDMTLSEMDRGMGTKSAVLEAIACLGAMGTSEAATRLILYLKLMNTITENSAPPDEQISRAVINNIGILGDKNAFDHLIYVTYLNYSETIKEAARQALDKLNW